MSTHLEEILDKKKKQMEEREKTGMLNVTSG